MHLECEDGSTGQVATFNVIDVFSGVGGFTLGFTDPGSNPSFKFAPRLMVDIDQEARDVATRNMPEIPFLAGDLAHLSGTDLRKAARMGEKEVVHVLLGGPPCQGFSRLGRGALEDPRNALLLDFLRLVKELRPLVAVMENVPMIMTSHDGAIIHEVSESLSAMGYSSVYENLLASDYGVPQHRRRAVLISYRADVGMLPRLPRRTHERFGHAIRLMENGHKPRFDVSKEPYISVEEAIGDLPSLNAGEGDEVMSYGTTAQNDYQRWARKGSIALFNHRSRAHSAAYLKKIGVIEEGRRNSELPKDQRFSDTYFSQAYARLHRNGIAQTITTFFANPGSGRFIHYRDLRSITVREAARLQSFPDRFVFDGTWATQTRHVGNAVPPLLARAVAKVIGDDLVAALASGDARLPRKVSEPRTEKPEVRSRTMRAVPSKNSAPERRLREALSELAVRGYRLHRRDLPGSPDLVFPSAKLALFVDGCFWHGCPICYRAPKGRSEYWSIKVQRNQARDVRVRTELSALGWRVMRIWEHEVLRDPSAAARRVKKALKGSRRAASR